MASWLISFANYYPLEPVYNKIMKRNEPGQGIYCLCVCLSVFISEMFQILGFQVQVWAHKYFGLKYKYEYKYFGIKYKYEDKYLKTVLESYTSTKCNISTL